MWECTVEIDIQAPVDAVYSRLSDLSRHADFADGLVTVRQTTPGPAGVGTRYEAQEQVPRNYVSESEIIRLEEPSLIAWRAWLKGVMRTEWELRLLPIEGGTRLVQVSRWWPAGLLGFVMMNVHRKRHVPAENRRTLERIKSALEAERPVVGRSA